MARKPVHNESPDEQTGVPDAPMDPNKQVMADADKHEHHGRTKREVWEGPGSMHVQLDAHYGTIAQPGDTIVTHRDGTQSVERDPEVVAERRAWARTGRDPRLDERATAPADDDVEAMAVALEARAERMAREDDPDEPEGSVRAPHSDARHAELDGEGAPGLLEPGRPADDDAESPALLLPGQDGFGDGRDVGEQGDHVR